MTSARVLLGAAGFVGAALGLATAAVPAAATAVPVSGAVSLFGSDYLLVAVFGAAGVGAVLALVARRSIRGVDHARPPDPEGLPAADTPGTDFDRLLGRAVIPVLWRWGGTRERVRERLREAAVVTVARESGRPRATARDRVDEGTWTDDRVAAAFLGESGEGDATGSFGRRARRTVRAIERVDGGERE